MSDVVILAENLSKRFRIGELQRYRTLRDTLTDAVYAPFRAARSIFQPTAGQTTRSVNNVIWAVRDVSFEIKRGQVVGIIGRNGAGKSTLLKILSRIIEPTSGYAKIEGRLASLLEVGTGFHPELTGYENIYLNGAILGMKKREIASKFDEIVAFAELERFIDTPVKYYSSGMYVRLAFAVAAHLEPEILLVDEVLAVGDTAFQKKCLGKMGDVARSGRTVLFVSHSMNAVHSLCDTGIVLNQGRVEMTCPVGAAIHHYHDLVRHIGFNDTQGIRGVKVLSIRVDSGVNGTTFTPETSLIAEMEFFTDKPLPKCFLNFVIEDMESRFLVHSRTDVADLWPEFDVGLNSVRVELPRLGLRSGVYTLWFRLYVNTGGLTEIADSERLMLEVNGPQVSGLVDIPCRWSWSPTV